MDRTARCSTCGPRPPKETGQGRTLRQEIKRIDTALRTHDGTALAEYGEFNAAIKKGAETRESPGGTSNGRGLD